MSQKQMVLDYMERFGSITSLDAFRDLGITRLSAVIFDLRAEGHEIKATDESGTNRFGELTRYARYQIEPHACDERGQFMFPWHEARAK